MTAALIIATAAATIAALLFRHDRNDLRDQRDELAAENDDLRGEVREWRTAAETFAADNERMRSRYFPLPRAPRPGEPLRKDLGAMDPPPDHLTLLQGGDPDAARRRKAARLRAVASK